METRKSPKSDLENKRGIFLLLGFVIASALALTAFEWNFKPAGPSSLGTLKPVGPEEQIAPVVLPEKPSLPPPPAKVEILNIVDNSADIAGDVDLFESEAGKDTWVDVIPVPAFQPNPEPEADNAIIFLPDVMPEFPGGEKTLRLYIAQLVKYPVVAMENGIKGTVYVSFVVERDGNISGVKIIRGVDPSLDKEALRVVSMLPKWKPGMQQGRPVRVAYTVPISFVLQ